MRHPSDSPHTGEGRATRSRDVVFLGVVIALFLACVIRDPHSDAVPFRSFHPLPDAIEYAVGAARLNAGQGLTLTINGHAIPSRYPVGFPLVIALCYRVLGDDIANAYWVSIVLAAIAIPLMFWLGLGVTADRTVARWSAFFLATNALILSFAPLVMSEICSVFVALVALNVAVRMRPAHRIPGLLALGSILGFGILVRTPNVLMIPPLFFCLTSGPRRPLHAAEWAAFLAPVVGGIGVIMLHNVADFGSPLRDGYALYAPWTLFAWRFFAANAFPYFRTLALAEGGKSIWLQGPFYGPLVPLLAAVGVIALVRAGRRDFVGLAVTWMLLFFFLYASYFFYDFRFFLPVLPILLLLAACGVGAVSRRLTGAQRAILACVVVVLYLAQPFSGGVSPLDAARRNRGTRDAPANYLYVQALNAYMDRIGARPETHVVLSPLNLVYLDHYSSKHYTIAALSPNDEYARVPAFAAFAAPPPIDDLLAQGREVYVSEFAADGEEARTAFSAIAERYDLDPILVGNAPLIRLSRKMR